MDSISSRVNWILGFPVFTTKSKKPPNPINVFTLLPTANYYGEEKEREYYYKVICKAIALNMRDYRHIHENEQLDEVFDYYALTKAEQYIPEA